MAILFSATSHVPKSHFARRVSFCGAVAAVECEGAGAGSGEVRAAAAAQGAGEGEGQGNGLGGGGVERRGGGQRYGRTDWKLYETGIRLMTNENSFKG